MTDTWERLARRMRPRPAGRCLIGISGGADSVALTMMLLPLRDAGEIELKAVHVNHGLRGAESDGDGIFTAGLCARLRIPLRLEQVDLQGHTDENTARRARYAAFERVLREERIPSLILAHQMEDQAETVLMRLIRGAGADGLRAMGREENREGYRILRPMLDMSGRELRDVLREEGIPWREDRTNRDPRYLRNRIRMEILPLMEEMAPGATARLARAAELIGLEADANAARAAEILRADSGNGWIGTALLMNAPEAVRSRALRQWWTENGPVMEERGLSYDQTRRLESLLEAPWGAAVNLPGEWRARRRKDRIVLIEPGKRTEKETAEDGT